MKMERRCENVIMREKCDRGGIRERLNEPLVDNQGALHGAELTNESCSGGGSCPLFCMFSVAKKVQMITKIADKYLRCKISNNNK